mmetsp:Transcript_71606/g.213687  ORF Transcript_71606/g.213687 Transcript_71606/m.213687 type:complete len:147 (-) Transcript_71606:358-798(-)
MARPRIAAWSRALHLVPFALLTVGPALEALGAQSFTKTFDAMLLAKATGLGPLPPYPVKSDWSLLGLNVLAAIGLLNLKVALTGEYELAKNMALLRLAVGCLNVKGWLDGAYSAPFAAMPAVELFLGALVYLTLPRDEARDKAKPN